MSQHPDLVEEQAYIDFAYTCLERSREDAWRLRDLTEAGRGGTFQARYERDVFDEARRQPPDAARPAATRRWCSVASTGSPRPAHRRDPSSSEGVESFHIGRLAVADEEREPVVVDWRAPVAEPFYRATGRDPMGLARRRHFAIQGRQLLDIEDELFGEGHLGVGPTIDDDATANGPGPTRTARLRHAASPRWSGAAPVSSATSSPPSRPSRTRSSAPAGRRARRAGRPGHRQDRRRPAPRRLPPLHLPVPARGPGRAGDRAQPPVPALHRAGAAVARRGRRRAGRARRPRARRRFGALRRRPDVARRPGQGRRPHGRRHRPRRSPTASGRCARTWSCPSAWRTCACAPTRPSASCAAPAAASGATTPARRFVEGEVFAALAASSRDGSSSAEVVRDRPRGAERCEVALERHVAGAHAGAAAPRPVRLARRCCKLAALRWLSERRVPVAVPAAARRRRRRRAGPTTTSPCSTRPASCLGPRPTAQRQGPPSDGQSTRRDPHLRPHRRRRGPGPHPDAAAHGRAPLAERLA